MTFDRVELLARFAAREKIGFALLSDPQSKIIGAFGLRDEAVPRDSKWYGFAHPMIFVVDAGGVIRHRFSEGNYQIRPDPDLIYRVLWNEIKS